MSKTRRLPAALGVALLPLAGCHHRTQTAAYPPPPAVKRSQPTPSASFDDTRGKPVFTETGIASWYGPGFHHKPGADGTVFDENAMTAAHRTLPMGSTARVTNLATGEQVLVRITDRGPFAPGRVIDLSKGAAKVCGVYRTGIAKVKVEGFHHASADPAGKWAVQTGAFKTQQDALDLKAALTARYRGAKVIEFAGPTGFWVRIDPAQHDRAQAEAMLDWIGKPDAQALPYLVRLD